MQGKARPAGSPIVHTGSTSWYRYRSRRASFFGFLLCEEVSLLPVPATSALPQSRETGPWPSRSFTSPKKDAPRRCLEMSRRALMSLSPAL